MVKDMVHPIKYLNDSLGKTASLSNNSWLTAEFGAFQLGSRTQIPTDRLSETVKDASHYHNKADPRNLISTGAREGGRAPTSVLYRAELERQKSVLWLPYTAQQRLSLLVLARRMSAPKRASRSSASWQLCAMIVSRTFCQKYWF
jgi:hypothetical protein